MSLYIIYKEIEIKESFKLIPVRKREKKVNRVRVLYSCSKIGSRFNNYYIVASSKLNEMYISSLELT